MLLHHHKICRETTPVKHIAGAADLSLVLSPTQLISVRGMAAYDLATERWLRLPRRDQRPQFGTRDGATAWWQDSRLFVFGGRAPDGSMDRLLWTFRPRLARGVADLPTRPRGANDGCVVPPDRGTWRLTGDPRDPMVAWAASGSRRIALWWPDGWTARFRPDLTVLDTRGRVVAREGDVCDVAAGKRRLTGRSFRYPLRWCNREIHGRVSPQSCLAADAS